MLRIFLLLLLATTCELFVSAQDTPLTLAEILTPGVANGALNEPFRLLFPAPVIATQTGISIRYTLVFALVRHEIRAACDPVILSFFGTKDRILKKLCTADNKALIRSYITYRVYASQFLPDAPAYANFLVRIGLTPFSKSRNTGTAVGWANVVADRLVSFLETDGWNSRGDQNREEFQQPYSDYTGYRPKNNPFQNPSKLKFPLRWQPLISPKDNRGDFAAQVHVLPQLGVSAMPLTLTPEEFSMKKIGKGPYKTPNKRGTMSKADMRIMEKQIDDFLRINQRLSTKQIAIAHWWDNKFSSLGNFAGIFGFRLGFDDVTREKHFFSETIAQYDSVLLAWKEKRRFDLVRPTTMIRRFLKGKKFKAYRGFSKNPRIGMVRGEDWEPVVPVQPHSEFPSASAVICRSTLELLDMYLKEILGNKTVPPFETTISRFRPSSSPVDRDVDVRFETLDDAWRSCGNSRLWAGVHFAPSVSAGFKLGKGLAEKVKDHMDDLYSGKVPKVCARCSTAKAVE